MQKIKILSKFIGLALFILAAFVLPNSNRLALADTTDDIEAIQNAIKASSNTCITTCFAGVANATPTLDYFKSALDNMRDCGNLLRGNICTNGSLLQANTLKEMLTTYTKDPNQSNLQTVLSFLGASTPPDTTGCITDENNQQLKNWLSEIAKNEYVAGAKASSMCASSNLTLNCLKTSIIPNLEKSLLAEKRGFSALANLDEQLLNLLKGFANCPNENNFNALNNFYNQYYIEERKKIIYSTIGYQQDEEDECLLNHQQSPCALPITFGWLNPANSTIGGLFYAVYLISRLILVIILDVFQWFLNPQNFGGYINFLNTGIVSLLFEQFKNFAYLGLSLAMIFTAIATILRSEKFGWQKMLPKLLIVALLVNFSLVICGMLIDLSNYLSMVSVYAFNSDITLANLLVNCSICPVVKSFYDLGGAWDIVRAAGLGTILTLLFAFQFFGLMMYVGTRIVTIIICLITSPLAFFTFAIPGGEKIWDFWRQRFQQALVVLPVICFIFYLSLFFITQLATSISQNIAPNSQGVATTVMAYMIFIIVFAQLIRYVSQFLGVEQVEKGFQIAKKAVTTAAMAGAAAVGGFALGKTVTSGGWKAVQGKLKQSNVTPLYNLGNWMDRTSKQVTQRKGAASEEFLKTQSDDEIRHYMNLAQRRGDKISVATAINELSSRNKLSIEDFDTVQAIRNVPSLNIKQIKKANPYLGIKLNQSSPEKRKEYFSLAKQQNPQASPEELNKLVNQIIEENTWKELANQVKQSSPSDLKEGNWKDILKAAKQRTQDDYYQFLYSLEENTTPEGLANIFQNLDKASLDQYLNDLINAIAHVKKISREETVDYLLNPPNPDPQSNLKPGRGFGRSNWWRLLLR